VAGLDPGPAVRLGPGPAARLADFVADTSAFGGLEGQEEGVLPLMLTNGLVALAGTALVELAWAGGPTDWRLQRDLVRGFEVLAPQPVDWFRALELQLYLWRACDVRGAGFVELLIVAAAERAGLTLLHDDPTLATVTAATGQSALRVAQTAA
jgi:predicted nucleic acid-binding protein